MVTPGLLVMTKIPVSLIHDEVFLKPITFFHEICCAMVHGAQRMNPNIFW